MEPATTPAFAAVPPTRPIDPARVADAVQAATAAVRAAGTPAGALDAGLATLHDLLRPCFVAALVHEHGRLWLVGNHGYAMIPDGLPTTSGIVGRAVRTGRTQYVPDLAADPDYLDAAKGVSSELAVPVELRGDVLGVLNVETVAPLPRQAAKLAGPLAAALAPVLAELRAAPVLDLSGLSRLFVHLSSLRDPHEIAEIGAASLTRVLPFEQTQVFLRSESGELVEAAARAGDAAPAPLEPGAVQALRTGSDEATVLQVVDVEADVRAAQCPGVRTLGLLPLRANGAELGVIVASSRERRELGQELGEIAAVLAAQIAASLDAALALGRERQSAVTDPLTSLLNRRGFELELEGALAGAHAERRQLSLAVLDFDDFKELNDRAGHEFGDALLREVGHVLPGILPVHVRAGRLGGDEFALMLQGTGPDVAVGAVEEIRDGLLAGLDEAGFPLRVSIGVATYPFDGGAGSEVLRAADQALYEAKRRGKNRTVVFRELVREAASNGPLAPSARHRRAGTLDTAALVKAGEAAAAIWRERTVQGTLDRLCKSLTFVVGATGCLASRVVGKRLVDVAAHAFRDIALAPDTSYLIDEFPVTKVVLETFEPCSISFLDDDLDRAEAFVLREVGMSCALLLPLVVGTRPWGLVELYDMRLRRYTADQQAFAQFLVGVAGQRIEALGDDATGARLLPLYRVPDAG